MEHGENMNRTNIEQKKRYTYIKIEIPVEWKRELEKKVERSGFRTLSEYIRFVIRREIDGDV